LIDESRINIKFMGQKYFAKKNYKIVIIMRFLLHQNIVLKMFMADTLLNTGYLLKL
jgi:hypothetical protein